MTRRSRRALPATLTALVLLAASVLVAVSAIQLALGEAPLLSYDALAGRLHDTTWSAPEMAVASGVATAIGLVLLLVAVVPGRARTAPLDDRTAVSVRGLRNALRTAAHVDGVESAAVKVRRRRVKTVVRTRRSVPDGLGDAVRAALEQRVGELALARPPQVVVRVKALRSTP
ncbi:DUF6286 domain-containing protein [Lentzea sp. BCCO 10_0856]|uniref:DUF6286 domain-containing protein n=1 Tax=Lentzea miocenica TaxID=3095431 RepID=A0ABU4SU30_9PSEU|nr:DUF6286 domain-containing protein [Lentzea sp. BCCO 10_0856]MDX8029417.1 DUF6286 domain-containing protein [Lentzea sp. BCCO 10_0856]